MNIGFFNFPYQFRFKIFGHFQIFRFDLDTLTSFVSKKIRNMVSEVKFHAESDPIARKIDKIYR